MFVFVHSVGVAPVGVTLGVRLRGGAAHVDAAFELARRQVGGHLHARGAWTSHTQGCWPCLAVPHRPLPCLILLALARILSSLLFPHPPSFVLLLSFASRLGLLFGTRSVTTTCIVVLMGPLNPFSKPGIRARFLCH